MILLEGILSDGIAKEEELIKCKAFAHRFDQGLGQIVTLRLLYEKGNKHEAFADWDAQVLHQS